MAWTIQQITDEASRRTNRVADTKLDLRMELFMGIDEFVADSHYWWRQRRATFTTVIGQQKYNMTQPEGGSVVDFQEFDEVILLNADGMTKQLELTPILDSIAQLGAINNTTPNTPSGYFIDTNTSLLTFMLQAPPNVAQKILYTYWSVPQITQPDSDDISFIPGHLHWGLVYVLERRIFEFLYGQDDPRFVTSNERYQEFCAKASRQLSWTAKKTKQMQASAQSVRFVRAHS